MQDRQNMQIKINNSYAEYAQIAAQYAEYVEKMENTKQYAPSPLHIDSSHFCMPKIQTIQKQICKICTHSIFIWIFEICIILKIWYFTTRPTCSG
jgi:hypothetical protein